MTSPLRGLRIAEDIGPKAIIVDDYMPEVTGLELLSLLRSIVRLEKTPIIFYSSGNDPLRRDEALAKGASLWLQKGLTPWGDIATKVDALLR